MSPAAETGRAVFEQRTCESFRRGASQHPPPVVPPSVRHRRLHNLYQLQLSHEHVGHHPPTSFQTNLCVPRLSPKQSPAGPELPLVRDDGHKGREDGHIGNDK